MLHPSTVPLYNIKLKRVLKVYHFLYNDIAGEKTMSKCQRTEELTRKVCALLYYVHMTTNNQIDLKFLRFLVMHFYRLVKFHILRHFRASLYGRVSDSGQPVTYTRKYCTNNTSHKIYRCVPSGSTQY